MSARHILESGDLLLGTPVRWNLYDQQGHLLLSQGQAVDNEERLHWLERVALKETSPTATTQPVFSRMNRAAEQLAALESQLAQDATSPTYTLGITALAEVVTDCVDDDADAAFAAPHLDVRHGYGVLHHLMAAVICALLSGARGWPREARQSLVAAALCHDIALLAYRQAIEQAETLPENLKPAIRDHGPDAARRLEALGVKDELWLRTVRNHHEVIDGRGYPHGLAGEAIGEELRIMALADALSAMLRPRPYRPRFLAPDAVTDLYLNREGRYDPLLIDLLIDHIGTFPPGSTVSLANREIAVTVRNHPDALQFPETYTLYNSHGRPLYQPYRRDTSDPEYLIVQLVPPESCHGLRNRLEALWSSTSNKH